MRSGSNEVRTVAVVGARSTSVADGIRDYSHRLIASLRARGDVDAKLFAREHSSFATRFDATEAGWDCESADAIASRAVSIRPRTASLSSTY